MVIFCLNPVPFASILSYIFMCRSGSVLGIRIQLLNTDPDP